MWHVVREIQCKEKWKDILFGWQRILLFVGVIRDGPLTRGFGQTAWRKFHTVKQATSCRSRNSRRRCPGIWLMMFHKLKMMYSRQSHHLLRFWGFDRSGGNITLARFVRSDGLQRASRGTSWAWSLRWRHGEHRVCRARGFAVTLSEWFARNECPGHAFKRLR